MRRQPGEEGGGWISPPGDEGGGWLSPPGDAGDEGGEARGAVDAGRARLAVCLPLCAADAGRWLVTPPADAGRVRTARPATWVGLGLGLGLGLGFGLGFRFGFGLGLGLGFGLG